MKKAMKTSRFGGGGSLHGLKKNSGKKADSDSDYSGG
jgi:hypothetical protein